MDTNVAEQAVMRLFPQSCHVVRRADEVAPAGRFWVVPGRQGPRWIVPQNPKHGWPTLEHWRPYGFTSRCKWAVLTSAYRAGQLGRLPGVFALGVAGTDEADWSRLGWADAEPPTPVIYVGAPGPMQKAVATLVAPGTHAPASVAKAPLGPEAAERITREAEVLAWLAIEKPGLAPRLLFLDRARGVATQEYVVGHPAGRRLTGAHLRWQENLRLTDETSLHAHVDRLRDRIAGMKPADEAVADLILRTLDSIDHAEPLQAVRVHGDFAPWNVMRRRDGSLRAIDWESCESPGLPLQDIFHYLYIQRFLFGAPRNVLGSLSKMPGFSTFLESSKIGRNTCQDLVRFFLAQSWVYRCAIDDMRHASFLAAELQAIDRPNGGLRVAAIPAT